MSRWEVAAALVSAGCLLFLCFLVLAINAK